MASMGGERIDPLTSIGAVALKVSDLGSSEAFYEGVLGLEVVERGEGRVVFGAGGAGLVHLEEVKGALPRPRRSTGLYHLALLEPSRPALGRALKRLVDRKYPLHGAADHLVSEALYLDDPDRNGIEIYRDRPKSEWSFDGAFVRMANEPVDLDGLLAEAELGSGAPSSSGLQAPEPPPPAPPPARSSQGEGSPEPLSSRRMGHVHLHVRDLDEAEDFYCGVMGFDVMLRWPPSALFISAGGYHHHIGLNTWAGVGAPPPPDDAAGLKWFEVVLPNSSALEKVVGRLEAAGVSGERRSDGILVRDPSMNGILLVAGS
jgi:catechol 2,3-dioxygenase